MTRLKLLSLLLIVFTFFNCKTHTFFDLKDSKLLSKDAALTQEIDFSTYEGYYRVAYRKTFTREKLYTVKPDDNDDTHLVDLQHLLISPSKKDFILISYVPVRFRGTNDSFYMDEYLNQYTTTVNVYFINLLIWGKIENSAFNFDFPDARENKMIRYTKTGNDVLFKSIDYNDKKQSHTDLSSTNEAFRFRPMASINLVSNEPAYHEAISNNVAFSKSKKGKTRILFEYLNGGDFKYLYYREHGNRFRFNFPTTSD